MWFMNKVTISMRGHGNYGQLWYLNVFGPNKENIGNATIYGVKSTRVCLEANNHFLHNCEGYETFC